MVTRPNYKTPLNGLRKGKNMIKVQLTATATNTALNTDIAAKFSWLQKVDPATIATSETKAKPSHEKKIKQAKLQDIVNEFLDNQFDDVADMLQIEDSDKFSLTIELDL